MLIDITLQITPESIRSSGGQAAKMLEGHIGTHFDVMNKAFPLEYTRLDGIVFDVCYAQDGCITPRDIDVSRIRGNMFVAFYTGFTDANKYSKQYISEHPQLSNELIAELLERKAAIIGVDFTGIRRGSEHTPKDQECADNGTFVIENLCNLRTILENSFGEFTAHTYPLNGAGFTGLPCRVIAEV